MYKNTEEEKWCPKCEKLILRGYFRKSKSRYDGCAPYCKSCQYIIGRERAIKSGKIKPFKCIKSSNGLKWCPKCSKIKEYKAFRKNKNRKDGLNNWCKSCLANHQREERSRSPVERELRYRKSEKGKITANKAMKSYRKTEKYKENILARTISNHIRYSLQTGKQGNSWKDLVSWSIEELKTHLEKQFKPGMSWKNHGKWHIDHKRPISSFNITNHKCDDFKKCWSLNNIQPLWKFENQSKGAKWKGKDWRYND